MTTNHVVEIMLKWLELRWGPTSFHCLHSGRDGVCAVGIEKAAAVGSGSAAKANAGSAAKANALAVDGLGRQCLSTWPRPLL